jgi:branched-chain amino acid aminotransferase
MTIVANVNGTVQSEHDAKISVFDHGFLFGEGVYETLRTYNGKVFLFDRHLRRLRMSAERITLAVPFDDAEFLSRIDATIATAQLDGEAYIRILLTRGVGEMTYDPAACPSPSVVIIVKPFVAPAPDVFERGVKLSLVSVTRNHPDTVNPIIKSNNLLNNALAMQEAFRNGAYEALMKNYRGELAECSQSNFFLVKDGVALTPPITAGLLQGVTRDFLFEVGPSVGVEVREHTLFEADLDLAEEAFITSTTREVAPVVTVDQRTIGTGRPGPVTLKLLEAFRKRADQLTRAAVLGRA